jgi:hypothetical protein
VGVVTDLGNGFQQARWHAFMSEFEELNNGLLTAFLAAFLAESLCGAHQFALVVLRDSCLNYLPDFQALYPLPATRAAGRRPSFEMAWRVAGGSARRTF